MEALSAMNDDDRLSVAAYLEVEVHGLRRLPMRKQGNLGSTTLMSGTLPIQMR